MSARETKQPAEVEREVATELMRTCYDEANRLANHGSNGLERMVMDYLYEAANEAKARLAAAAADGKARESDAGPRSSAARGWAALAEYLRREIDEARSARDISHANGAVLSKNYWDGKQSALDQIWNVFAAELQAPPRLYGCARGLNAQASA